MSGWWALLPGGGDRSFGEPITRDSNFRIVLDLDAVVLIAAQGLYVVSLLAHVKADMSALGKREDRDTSLFGRGHRASQSNHASGSMLCGARIPAWFRDQATKAGAQSTPVPSS